ncbi:MAG: SAM-dependent DNA methyltransferase [Ruminococcaceae bacterium]|nr:SAM-dependent DNA methyltransferase [Oscillospiraceae bacterium]
MITGELKNRIDSLWDIFAAGGLVNPLDVIEQITYLMFIHDLDETDNLRAKESAMLGLPHKSIFAEQVQIGDRTVPGQQLKWSVFRDFPAGKMYTTVQEWVFPFIKNLHADKNSAYSKYMDDAIFKLPTPLLLDKVVSALDEIYEQMAQLKDADVRGDVYEYLLNKIRQSGLNGQFRTPRHIIKMMVALMQPRPDDVICDPACGTAGFLVEAGEYLKEHRKQEVLFDRANKDHYMNHMFHGYDMDRTMLRIGAMNMMTHGVDNPFIEYRDSLSDQNPDKEKYSLILANPPFKGSLDYDTVSADLLKVCKTKKTELLFLALFLRMLKIGGRGAVIVPDGVLFGSSAAHKAIRKELVDGNRLEAVISMPSGVFKPYAGVSTGILIFTKTGHGGTDKVWFYDMTADGFSLDDKRTPVADNDIPDIIARFHSFNSLPLEGKVAAKPTDEVATYDEASNPRTAKSFFVPKDEIVQNDYDLSINKYKKTEYKAVAYAPTSEIMAELQQLEAEIAKGLHELEGML